MNEDETPQPAHWNFGSTRKPPTRFSVVIAYDSNPAHTLTLQGPMSMWPEVERTVRGIVQPRLEDISPTRLT